MHNDTHDTLFFERLSTPVGDAQLLTDRHDRVRAFDWCDHHVRMTRLLRRHYGDLPAIVERPKPSGALDALQAYFGGDLTALDALSVETGGTAFQRQVWTALRTVPAGQAISYAALADRIGRPRAIRAVGLANGANPIGIIVPCHRVIGADGSLTGYSGGLERKRWLLAHEGVPIAAISGAPRLSFAEPPGPNATAVPHWS